MKDGTAMWVITLGMVALVEDAWIGQAWLLLFMLVDLTRGLRERNQVWA